MKLATAAEMRQIDHDAIEGYGLPGVVLMENAGGEVARCMEKIVGDMGNKKICIFAGKGNNGGDGYVVARHLHNQGAKVKLFLLGEKGEISGDARIHLDVLLRMGVDVLEIVGERDWDKVKLAVTFADVLVDALLGIGFRGGLEGAVAQAVESINGAGKPVFAIDTPSGVEVDTGQVSGNAVKADYTITMGLPKPGLFLYPGAEYAGQVRVADIGLPAVLLSDSPIKQNVLLPGDIHPLLPGRPATAHKGSCGKVGVIAGSPGLTGASCLTSLAALRAGAGLVTLGISSSLHDIMEMKLTEVMTKPLLETSGGAIGIKAVPQIMQLAAGADVLAIGPGLGREEETMAAVQELVRSVEIPLVLDADALYALNGCPELLNEARALPVITPHCGEMARLTGLTPEQIQRNRMAVARQAASDWNSIVVLKGARTLIAFPDGEIYINTTGNAGMATGGTGDVLTGVIAALIAQGLSSHAAALAGVYLHGLAGDIAAHGGAVGLIAGDVVRALPAAIYSIQQECPVDEG